MKKLTIPLAENAIAAKNNDRDGEWAVYVEASAPDAQLKEACKMIPGWGSERFTCFEVRFTSPRRSFLPVGRDACRLIRSSDPFI